MRLRPRETWPQAFICRRVGPGDLLRGEATENAQKRIWAGKVGTGSQGTLIGMYVIWTYAAGSCGAAARARRESSLAATPSQGLT